MEGQRVKIKNPAQTFPRSDSLEKASPLWSIGSKGDHPIDAVVRDDGVVIVPFMSVLAPRQAAHPENR